MEVFAVLADATRRDILGHLRHQEASVGELVEAVDLYQPGVSRHLRILQDASLVKVRKDAQRRLYSLNPAGFQAIEDWLAAYRAALQARYDRLDAHLKRPAKAKEK